MHILFLILGAALLYYLQHRVYLKYWDRHLSLTIHLSKDHAVAGEKITLTEEIINQKFLPLPVIRVKFQTDRELFFDQSINSNVSDRYYRDDLITILSYQKFTRTLDCICSHRGFYTIDTADFVCNDLFFSLTLAKQLPIHETLYVYPRLLDGQFIDIPFQKMIGSVLTKRLLQEDPFEFAGIREYQTYDDMKSINWKATARTGSLKVNVHGYTACQEFSILLNLDEPSLLHHDDLMELSISLAATYANALIEKGIPVSLYSNGLDLVSKSCVNIPAGCGPAHLSQINEALSRIKLDLDRPEFTTSAHSLLWSGTQQAHILLISSSQKAELQDRLLELKQNSLSFTWIVPLDSSLSNTIHPELSQCSYPIQIEDLA